MAIELSSARHNGQTDRQTDTQGGGGRWAGPTSARAKNMQKTRHASSVTGRGRRAGRQGGVCAAVCRAGARERARRDAQAMRGQRAWACASLSSAKNPAGKSHHRVTGPRRSPSHPIRSHPAPSHPVPSDPIGSHRIPSDPIGSHPIAISSHPIQPALGVLRGIRSVQSKLVPRDPIRPQECPISGPPTRW